VNYVSPRFQAAVLHRHGRTVSEDVRIAAHEGGHCIGRAHFGMTIRAVRIEPETLENGKVRNGRVQGDPGDCDGDGDCFNRLISLVAGNIGEEVYLGEAKGLRGSDRRKALRYARYLCESDEAVKLMIAAAEADARHILDDNFHLLDALASRLLEVREMTGTEVLALIDRLGGLL
jgi:hypothetical protein